MWNALDINTKAVIATAATRKEAAALAEKIVGREGFCVRPVHEEKIETPANWATTDGEWWV
jgi:hypothetical protein